MRTTRTAVLIVAILAATLLLAAGALAHGGEDHGGSGGTDANETDAGTGPRPHLGGYERFLGRPFWGDVSVLTDASSRPADPAVSAGWIAWVDQDTGDLFAYNDSRGVRVRVTDDGIRQRSPSIDGDRLVWIESDATTYRVAFYDLQAGRNEVLYETDEVVQEPTIDGRWVAWQVRHQDEGSSRASWDIRAYDLRSGRTLPVATGPQSDVDPAIAGDHVAWRQREYTQWDVWVEDLESGRERRATADVNVEDHLRAGPRSFMFTKERRTVPDTDTYRYYPSSDRAVETGMKVPSARGPYPTDDSALYLQPYVRNRTLSLYVDETGVADRLHFGRLDITDLAVGGNRSVALVVETGDGPRLVSYTYSRLAEAPRPRVVIEEPSPSSTVTNLTTVRGRVAPEGWPQPTQVYVSLKGNPQWVVASGTTTWQTRINLSQIPTGRHVIEVAADFPGGPPQRGEVSVVVGQPLDFTKDLSPRFESEARSLLSAILGTIPLLIVLVLAVLVVVLFLARTYLRWLRERYPEARYVRPDEPRPPNGGQAEGATGDGGASQGDNG